MGGGRLLQTIGSLHLIQFQLTFQPLESLIVLQLLEQFLLEYINDNGIKESTREKSEVRGDSQRERYFYYNSLPLFIAYSCS